MTPYRVVSVLRLNTSIDTFAANIEGALNNAVANGYLLQWAAMPSDRTFYAIVAAAGPVPSLEKHEDQNEEKGEPDAGNVEQAETVSDPA